MTSSLIVGYTNFSRTLKACIQKDEIHHIMKINNLSMTRRNASNPKGRNQMKYVHNSNKQRVYYIILKQELPKIRGELCAPTTIERKEMIKF